MEVEQPHSENRDGTQAIDVFSEVHGRVPASG
jgi:hypothetical protein